MGALDFVFSLASSLIAGIAVGKWSMENGPSWRLLALFAWLGLSFVCFGHAATVLWGMR